MRLFYLLFFLTGVALSALRAQVNEINSARSPLTASDSTASFSCVFWRDHSPPGNALSAPRSFGGCLEVEIALAAGYDLFVELGSVAATRAFMLNVLDEVQKDYTSAFNDELRFKAVAVFVATTPAEDPVGSPAEQNPLTIIEAFVDWAEAGGFGTAAYDLAGLWLDRTFTIGGQSISGAAYNPGVCTGSRYHILSNFSSNQGLLRGNQAHEIGHNFDADHVSGNVIMNPTVNTSNTWSSQNVNTVNAHYPTVNCLSACPAFPVELLAFNGSAEGGANRLSWVTATEEAFSHFELQRRREGDRRWTVLGEMKGKGADAELQSYAFLDADPPPQSYYRLKMIDLDGTHAISKTIRLETDTPGDMRIWPNPGRDRITVSADRRIGEPVDLVVLSAYGRAVWSGRKALLPLEIPSLPAGHYVLKWSTATTRGTGRFLVVE